MQQNKDNTQGLLENERISLYTYVGNIPLQWSKQQILQFFSKWGTILEVRPILQLGRFTGAAQVQFHSMTDAQQAILQLNKQIIPGFERPLNMKWLDTEEQRLGVGQKSDHRVFIGSLPRQVNRESLYDLFSIFGQIETIVLEQKQYWALLCYKRKQSALLSIKYLNGQAYMHGSKIPIQVRFKQKKYNSFMSIKKHVKEQLDPFHFNVDNTYYQQILVQQQLKFYHYKTKTIVDQLPPGAKVFSEKGNYMIPENKLRSGELIFGSKKSGPLGANLFIFHLPNIVKEAQLYQVFKKYGNIISVSITLQSNGKHKGMGFVSYDNAESAKFAVEEMNGYEMRGKKLKVDINLKDKTALSYSKPVTNLLQANFDF